MTYDFTPYDTGKNLGRHYNKCMDLLGDDDVAIFRDADVIYTTHTYGTQIDAVLKRYPTIGAFSCLTNRVVNKWQLADVNRESNDMVYHRKIGKQLQDEFYDECVDKTNAGMMSGMLMVIRKSLWKKFGRLNEHLMLGIDNQIHRKIMNLNERIYLMKGVYVYHWYSNHNPESNKQRNISHLIDTK